MYVSDAVGRRTVKVSDSDVPSRKQLWITNQDNNTGQLHQLAITLGTFQIRPKCKCTHRQMLKHHMDAECYV